MKVRKNFKVPVITPRSDRTSEPNPVIAICGDCGIELRKIMFFSCRKDNCPCQAKITF